MIDLNDVVFLPGSIVLDDKPFEQSVAEKLEEKFNHVDDVGYFGYKWTSLSQVDDDLVPTFLFVTKKLGVVIVDIVSKKLQSITDDGDFWKFEDDDVRQSRDLAVTNYYNDILGRLRTERSLLDKRTRQPFVKVSSLLYFADNTKEELSQLDSESEYIFSDYLTADDGLDELFANILFYEADEELSDDQYSIVLSLLDGTHVFQTKFSKDNAPEAHTINDLISLSLNKTFTQDKEQKLISGQLPSGPQRIRGLAGTGKTVVLSLKAGIAHARKPGFKILFLFNTRSLYKQISDLITKYYVSEVKKQPDIGGNIEILHAWGGNEQPGLYSQTCDELGLRRLTLQDVRFQGDGLQAIYKDLLKNGRDRIKPKYDMILIDEAQDFPDEVFETVFLLCKEPKRIIWAYDEFQSLKDMFIKKPEELFGLDEEGEPNITTESLQGEYPGPVKKDFILPNSYRNPRINLMIAHAVALCLYTDKIAPLFEDDESWSAIGYEVETPKKRIFDEGDRVVLSRPDSYSRNNLEAIVDSSARSPDLEAKNQLFNVAEFNDKLKELDYIVSCIKQLIDEENVPAEEIIVINLDTKKAKSDFAFLRNMLNQADIDATTPGFIEGAHVFKEKGKITLTTPFRAKGNEANIVFIMNCQRVNTGYSLQSRNSFFVSVTRSRGWVYATGTGEKMGALIEEVNLIKADYPKFKFDFPNKVAMGRARRMLDLSEQEIRKTTSAIETLKDQPELLKQMLDEFPELRQQILDIK
jgi:superfamily I DNA and RNA helicase